MRYFNLDLLIGKDVVVNCKTKGEADEFLKFLDNKGIKWNSGNSIFKSGIYDYSEFKETTCFLLKTGMLQYSPISWYQEEGYKIISLDDITIFKVKNPLYIPKNNFKDYGFEADFEGEIKFIDSFDHYIGICEWSKEMPTKTKDKQTVYWVKNKCYLITLSGILRISSRDLTPIKKEWYLNKDNFEEYKGKIIINKYGNIRMIQSIDENKVSTFEQNMYHDIIRVEEWRPATKEEILSLMMKI